MAYDAGEAFLRIIPSFDGVIERINAQAAQWGATSGATFSRSFNERVRRDTNVPVGPSQQQSRRQGEQAGRTFADSFRARVDAALRSLPDITIDADSTPAEVRIARLRTNLEQLRDQRIGVDIDAETALATVENLRRQIDELGRESPDVAVRVDTARAIAELDRIKADIDILRAENPEVDVEVDDHGSIDRTAGKVNALRASLIALSPVAIPVGAALVAGLAGAAAVIGAIAAGVGVLTLGLSGVGSTIDLLNQKREAIAGQRSATGSDGSAQAGRALADARYNAAQQAISSAEAVKRAQESLADTERRIARQAVDDAHRVADAQRNLAGAQQAVHDAREQAKRDLQDAANAAADANLSQSQAQIDLANAQEKLRQVNADWTSTAEERRQAELDVAKAQQALTEAGEKANRATDDNNKAQKAGVNGAPGVVAALRRQKDAVEALHEARVRERQDAADGAREIARAEQGVTDALREQRNQAHASAEAILNAQDAVASSGTAGADALDKINDKLAKVNPATLAFARFWRNQMSPIFDQLKGQAASGLLPGLERGLKIMQPLFAPLGRFIHSMAQAIGGLFVDMAKAFTSPFWTRFFAFLDRNLPRWLTQFGHIFGNVVTGFAGIFRAFGPIISAMGRGLVSITGRFADFGRHLGRSSAFQSFLAYVRQNGPIVVDFFGNLFRIAGKLIQGLAPLGHVMAVVFDVVSKFLASLSPDQLLLLIAAIGTLVALLGGPVLAVVVAVTAAAALLARNWDKATGVLGPLIKAIKGALLQAFDGLRKALGYISDALHDHRKQFEALVSFLSKYVIPVLGFLAKTAFKVLGEYIAFVIRQVGTLIGWIQDLADVAKSVGRFFAGPFVDFFTGAWDTITGVFHDAWAGIKTGARDFVDGIKTIWTRLENIFKAPIRFIVNTVINDALIAAWDWVADKIHFGHIDKIPLPTGFAAGGVYPGYTPGRDIGYIGVSGGEAVMRPEWTRAVGPGYVHAANAAARSGGEQGVARFLGGFAGGGIIDSLNPLTYIHYIKDKITGPLHDLIAKFGSSDWVKMAEHVPLGIASNMYDAIKHAIANLIKKLGIGAVNIGAGIGSGLLGGSVHIGGTGSIVGGTTPSANERLADSLLGRFGWGPSQAFSLGALWQRESGWSQFADTRVSGLDPANATTFAYGIAQARPATKYPLAGRPSDLGGESNPLSQILWGLGYIKNRYSDPDGAWAHELKFNWYDRGGELQPGLTLAYNGTGQAEMVAPRQSFEDLINCRGGGEMRLSGDLGFRSDALDPLGIYIDGRIDERLGFGDATHQRVSR